ncbi:hypothetical protein JW905_13345 [bacterium]|nr:hypothetical protein [candidate division CSSED10-310 bacterium]
MAGLFGTTAPAAPAASGRIAAALRARGEGTPQWITLPGLTSLLRVDRQDGNGFLWQDTRTGLLCLVDGYVRLPGANGRDEAHRHAEFICRALADDPVSAAAQLAGSFSMAVYDPEHRRLLLIRDHAGSRPLYYGIRDRFICFSSTIRAIHRSGFLPRELNPAAVDRYLAMIAVPDPGTAFNGIRQIPPGYLLDASDGKATVHAYWRMYDRPVSSAGEEDLASDLRVALDDAVHDAVHRPGRVGSFLSGGHDTTVVAAIAAKDRKLTTFTIGYGGGDGYEAYNEFPFAAHVAERIGADHRESVIQPGVVDAALPRLVWHLENPSGDAINSYLVSQFAAGAVDMVLTGTGGDEIFVGSHWFLQLFRLNDFERRWRKLPAGLRRLMLAACASLADSFPLTRKLRRMEFISSSPAAKYAHLKFLIKEDERTRLYSASFASRIGEEQPVMELIEHLFAPVAGKDQLSQFIHLFVQHELANLQLRDLDVMSYAHGLEARSPLVDRRVLERIAGIPSHLLHKDGRLRHMMIRACGDVLPQRTIERRKMSFIVPMSIWAAHELRDPILRLLSRESVEARGFLRPDVVREVVDAFYSGREPHPFKLWNLALLELWCRVQLDHDADEAPTEALSDWV